MHSKAASYNTLAQLSRDKFINNQDKVFLTPEERSEALGLLGCSSWKDIERGIALDIVPEIFSYILLFSLVTDQISNYFFLQRQ